MQDRSGCIGDTAGDPLGATFEAVYNLPYHYVVWNDEFYQSPKIVGCGDFCSAPWGHSKGMLAWNDDGAGLVLQVTTPSWPASGSSAFPRTGDGNTLGCVEDNNVLASQHFFALQLTKEDVIEVLQALGNASVVTDPTNPQLVNNGGPPEVQALVAGLGKRSVSTTPMAAQLSTGVLLIAKPSHLNVPPWQLVSALLGGEALRAATWWATPKIDSTTGRSFDCWDGALRKPGAVEIAISGAWDGIDFSLVGGVGAGFNHAKFSVSTAVGSSLAIFFWRYESTGQPIRQLRQQPERPRWPLLRDRRSSAER